MLPTLLACAAILMGQATAGSVGDLSQKQFFSLLEAAGYKVVPSKQDWRDGLTRVGHPGTLSLMLQGGYEPPAKKDEVSFVCVRLKIEFATPRTLDIVAPTVSDQEVDSFQELRFVPHIGNTITASAILPPLTRCTPKAFLAKLDQTWDSIESYAKREGAKLEPVDRKKLPPLRDCDDRLFAFPDQTSIRRLTTLWGWEYKGGQVSHGPGWYFPITVEKRTLWLSGRGGWDGSEGDRFYLATAVNLGGASADKWIAENGAQHPEFSFFRDYEPTKLGCSTEIVLTPKTKVKDVKQQIQAFADRVEKLAKELNEPTKNP